MAVQFQSVNGSTFRVPLSNPGMNVGTEICTSRVEDGSRLLLAADCVLLCMSGCSKRSQGYLGPTENASFGLPAVGIRRERKCFAVNTFSKYSSINGYWRARGFRAAP